MYVAYCKALFSFVATDPVEFAAKARFGMNWFLKHMYGNLSVQLNNSCFPALRKFEMFL